MATQVALLRAINVAGHNPVTMADLRKLCEDLGLVGVQSILQSGNLVFQGGRRAGPALERLFERETADRLGVHADYLVRSADEWELVIARNPFPGEAKNDPGHLVVMFMKSAPAAQDVAALVGTIKGRETVHQDGKQLYIVYPDGIGRSKLTGKLIEQKLGTRGTARNWNTVLKIQQACQED